MSGLVLVEPLLKVKRNPKLRFHAERQVEDMGQHMLCTFNRGILVHGSALTAQEISQETTSKPESKNEK